MRDSLRLGRIFGVRVGIHWSLLVLVALVASGLAENRFSIEAPGHSDGAYVTAGILTALGLLAGVFLHELAHALVARRQGMTVDGITLSWMGGITRMDGESRRPSTELMVAGVGPLTSAALGGALALIRLGVPTTGMGALDGAALGWLAWINVVLAAFNLLPAAPLDGGRVLHALVWAAGKDRWRATRVAAGTGVALGAVTVAAGLIVAEHSRNLFSGLIIGFMGWWLLASARAELGSGAAHHSLDGVRVADIMRPVGEAPGWITIRAFMEQYAATRPGWVWLLRDWSSPSYRGLLVGDTAAAVPYPSWDLARPVDVSLPIAETTGARPDEDVLAVAARSGGKVILAVADGHTLGAVLPGDLEAFIRSGRRIAPDTRPAPGRA